MGSYSVICAVSGSPLEYFNEAVGLELEPYLFPGERYAYVPKSWPVFGRYDTVGGIEDEDLSPNAALIRREVWDNAELYWPSENRKYGRGFLDIESALAEARRQENLDNKIREMDSEYRAFRWTPADYLYYELAKQFTRTDEGLVLREMLYAKNSNVTGIPEKHSYLERGAFMEALLQKILVDGWTYEISDTLYRLVCLWAGQMLTGRQIIPSVQVSIEQCPVYKQRIKIEKFQLDLLRGNVKAWKEINSERKV
jgi:hypothetical protein